MPYSVDELGGSDDLPRVKKLFQLYADWLETIHGIPPETHGIEDEILGLPKPYAPPDGALIGARSSDGTLVGCVALRRLDAQSCEVKRLFVLPDMRGQRLGEALVTMSIEKARTLGYAQIVLDVGEYQEPARALYAKCGFTEIAPMDHITYAGAIFMAYDL